MLEVGRCVSCDKANSGEILKSFALFAMIPILRAFSSGGLECHVDIVEVTGSSPVTPTNKYLQASDLQR